MKRPSDEEIARLLRARHVPCPPPGLAERIKAEIPELVEMGGRPTDAGGGRRGPGRLSALRPMWLVAASLLVVIGVGFVAVQLWQPGRNLAREIALDGLAVPDAYEIVVPPRLGVAPGPSPSPGPTPNVPAPVAGPGG